MLGQEADWATWSLGLGNQPSTVGSGRTCRRMRGSTTIGCILNVKSPSNLVLRKVANELRATGNCDNIIFTMRSRYTSRRSLRSINSSSSDSSSNSSDSSSSSDECAVPVVRPANKLERLRRIFLSQPQESPTARSPRRHARALSPAARSRVFGSPDRIRSRCGSSVIARRHAGSDAEEAKDDGKEGELDSSTDEENTVKQTRLSIDNHIHSLCEQVKRMTMQRESAASQLHTMLDQAIEELQFLKRQEERGLQCHIKQIEEVRPPVVTLSAL